MSADSIHFQKGIESLEFKKYQEALSEFNQAIKINPKNPSFYNNKGFVLFNLKKLHEAVKEYTNAIEIHGKNAVYYNNRGNAYKDLKKYAEALADCEKAIELNPLEPNFHSCKGAVLKSLKRNQEAVKAFSIAINMEPLNSLNYANKGFVLFELNKFDEALVEYEHAIRLNPNNASYYNNKGFVLFNFNKYEEAKQAYEKAISLNPLNFSYLLNKAKVLFEVKDYENALKDYLTCVHNRKQIEGQGIYFIDDALEKIEKISFEFIKEKENLKQKLSLIKDFKRNVKDEFEKCIANTNKIQNLSKPIELLIKKYEVKCEKVDFRTLHLGEELFATQNYQFKDFFTCKVCLSIVREPMSCEKCEDLFCSICIHIFKEKSDSCPLCRAAPFKDRKINKFNKYMLNEMQIFCPLGCAGEFSYENLKKHLNFCEFVTKKYKCKLCNWEETVLKNDMRKVYDHDAECSALIQCPFCFNDFETLEIKEHYEKFCEEKVSDCVQCGLKIPGKFNAAHEEFFCKKFRAYVNFVQEIVLDKIVK